MSPPSERFWTRPLLVVLALLWLAIPALAGVVGFQSGKHETCVAMAPNGEECP